jgi:hypothetical protein
MRLLFLSTAFVCDILAPLNSLSFMGGGARRNAKALKVESPLFLSDFSKNLRGFNNVSCNPAMPNLIKILSLVLEF